MITISTFQNKGVPVTREDLALMLAAGLVVYSLERMRFESASTKVSPYVLATVVSQMRGTPGGAIELAIRKER